MSGQVNYLVEAPELEQEYYLLYIEPKPFYVLNKWGGKDFEQSWLKNHRLYPTKEDVERAIEFVKDFYISHEEQFNYLTSEPKPGAKVWFSINMNESPFDIASINFDPKTILQPYLLKSFLLYGTREDLIKDINLITEALEEEYKKSSLNSGL